MMICPPGERMEEHRSHVTQRVLSLTLEIICLLTGEDYTIVKKPSGDRSGPHGSELWSRTLSRIIDPTCHSQILEGNTEQKILQYTSKITELLTGEVPVRYEDITVSFSMDEWEYVESHKDLYEEIVLQNPQPPIATGVSSNKVEEKVHKWCKQEEEEVHMRRKQEEEEELMRCKQEAEVHTRCDQKSKEAEVHVWYDQPCKQEQTHERCDRTYKEEESYIRCDQKCKEEKINTNIRPASSDKSANPESKKEVSLSPKVSSTESACTPGTTPVVISLCSEASDSEEHSPLYKLARLGPDAECEKTPNLPAQQTIHTEKLFLCTDCGRSFALKADLIQHWRIHMKEKPFQCCECGECFTTKANCTKHFRIHRGKTPYQCSECGKCFIKKSSYCNHQRVHTGGPLYPCSKCSKSFAHKCSLVKHKRTHAGERAFSCSECEKSFSEKCDFVRHLRTHTGEKPYSCTECGKGFTQKSNLARHQKTHMYN